MVQVEGGQFQMGLSKEDPDAYGDESPVHYVLLDTFFIGKFQVTQAFWQAVTGENPSNFRGENRPVEQVSWDDITKIFLPKLNELTQKNYRLPTEAEWEFAARGGNLSENYKFSGSDKLRQVAWFAENSDNQTHEVGQRTANELGVFDMSGNVWEWCADWFGDKYYEECFQNGVVKNPTGADGGVDRVYRGGSSFDDPRYCRVSYRYPDGPSSRYGYLGFRLALSPSQLASHAVSP